MNRTVIVAGVIVAAAILIGVAVLIYFSPIESCVRARVGAGAGPAAARYVCSTTQPNSN